jgi:hypothetical protein
MSIHLNLIDNNGNILGLLIIKRNIIILIIIEFKFNFISIKNTLLIIPAHRIKILCRYNYYYYYTIYICLAIIIIITKMFYRP